MNNSDDLLLISDFLHQQHVLTLCAGSRIDASHDIDMWCANCFYLFDEDQMALFLMTEQHTRHSELMLINPQVVGTVTVESRTIELIKGIQYRGEISLLSGDAEQTARARYCHRFPVAKTAIAPLWQLNLLEIKMTHNALGFGKKLHWERP